MGNPRAKKRGQRQPGRPSPGISITEMEETKNGYSWTTYLVQGWREDGRWQKRRFKDRAGAEAFAAVKRVELLNEASSLRSVATRLSADQIRQAEAAFARLGSRYDLEQATNFFLTHFCEPDHVIAWGDAAVQYDGAQEHSGVRPNTRRQTRSVLTMAEMAFENPPVHEVTPSTIEAFLRGLRAKDGTNRAAPKTWNNVRGELHAFLTWCADPRRRWIPENPVTKVSRLQPQSRGLPEVLTANQVLHVMSLAARWRGGILARPYAVLLFAGIRPAGELRALAQDEKRFIDIERGVIHVEPRVSKTSQYRQIPIRPNLARWLDAFPGPLIPPNYDRLAKAFRRHCELGHDVARHTFISHHVAAFRSVGSVSLEAGNSESVVQRHYLNLHSATEGSTYWQIVPAQDRRRAVIDTAAQVETTIRLA